MVNGHLVINTGGERLCQLLRKDNAAYQRGKYWSVMDALLFPGKIFYMPHFTTARAVSTLRQTIFDFFFRFFINL